MFDITIPAEPFLDEIRGILGLSRGTHPTSEEVSEHLHELAGVVDHTCIMKLTEPGVINRAALAFRNYDQAMYGTPEEGLKFIETARDLLIEWKDSQK
ncbi:hypothetical protein [Streptomyces sp. 769]|uniref:hypothetical protein n=1 Tax=Streptomyces sp. 769 TaxID=1262452 RepID=UPI00057D03F4|nr:hypothetical protein [Streptomyces sp. 769]AJC58548.1 hypothetical protein GZL_05975 [Streptomyces sp. 769]